MLQETYRVIFAMLKDYNSLPKEKKKVSLAYKPCNNFTGFMLSCQIVYPFFFNNQYVLIKIEDFTVPAPPHDHEKQDRLPVKLLKVYC